MFNESAPQSQSGILSDVFKMTPEEILNRARTRAKEQNLLCAGAVTPEEAWALVCADAAVIVDVRTQEEHKFVGYVPDSILIPWMCGNSMVKNPSFISECQYPDVVPECKTFGRCCRSPDLCRIH